LRIDNLVLGAGISGLSLSYMIGHDKCVVLEQKGHLGGHCSSFTLGGTVWDEGPHVCFTGDKFVLYLFKDGVDGNYVDLEISTGNYWYGHWLPHPVQMYLGYLPGPVRDECLFSFLEARKQTTETPRILNYGDWVEANLGKAIKRNFIEKYTSKYWGCATHQLATDWIGPRVRVPSVEEIERGATERSIQKHHYVQKAIYPREGGFQGFIGRIARDTNVIFDTRVASIDLLGKSVTTVTGETYFYERLLSTIPLPSFVEALTDAPKEVTLAAARLRCTSVSLVNIVTRLKPKIDHHWFYVYDEDMVTTRVTSQHLLSRKNLPDGHYGYQVEVYSQYGTRKHPRTLVEKVTSDLQHLGLVDEVVSHSYRFIPYANVIPDIDRRECLEVILQFLSNHGLIREVNDTHPIHSEHDLKTTLQNSSLIMAGRYAQWTYGWTDDCVKRAQSVSGRLKTS